MKTKNFAAPKPDDKGRYRPVIGRNDDGKPQRFQVGNIKDTTATEVQRRIDYLRQFYERQCDYLAIDYWDDEFLPWAKRIATEGQVRVYGTENAKTPQGAASELETVHFLRSWGLPIVMEDQGLQQRANGYLKQQIEIAVNQAVKAEIERLGHFHGEDLIQEVSKKTIPENLADAETKKLHEAMDAYRDYIKSTGSTYRIHVRVARVKYLKQHHDDLPLWRLNFPACEKMIIYWRNRPLTKKGTRCSAVHSENMIKELYSFWNWLDTEPSFKWLPPRGLEKIERPPIDIKEDRDKEAFRTITKKTYNVEQLKILTEHCDGFEKALLAICVNCAFDASEIGQWGNGGYSLYKPHPYADPIGIITTEKDSWVTGDRPKTGVYGEHLLWPEVAAVIKPFVDEIKAEKRATFCVTQTGTPMYKENGNPQAKFQKRWNKILDRVRETHKDFPRLPFGSLRDLFPDILRQKYNDAVADLALQHGDPKEHNLLKCYANRPYGKLFEATREMKEHFKPFLDALLK